MTFGGHFGKPSVGNSCLVPRLLLMTYHYFGGLLWGAFCRGQLLSNRSAFDYFSLLFITFGEYFGKPSVGDSCLVIGPLLMTCHYFGESPWKAFRRGQLLSNQVTFDDFPFLRRLPWEVFRRGHLLSNRATFDDFSLLRGLLWEAFRRGQLLSNRVTFDYFSLLRRVTLVSLPSGTAA